MRISVSSCRHRRIHYGQTNLRGGRGTLGDDGTFGMPCFVLTQRSKAKLVKGPTTFTFITGGIDECLKQAKAAAGEKTSA